ncbi:hypothetical protein Tco_0756825 [Tanacetum coccineum]
MFVPTGSTLPTLQTVEDLQGDELVHYDAEIKLMNLILLSIPNEIYNYVDACTMAKEINTKFLNSLQPEWLKYVTQVCLAKRLTVDSFDDLFDYLQQFKKLVNASRAKKLEKSHDPLALVAHTSSSSRITSSYYVTHPTSVVEYDDEYQQDDVQINSENPLASAMLLLARAITQNFLNYSSMINSWCFNNIKMNLSTSQGDLRKFSDIGAWYAIEDCAQYDKKCNNPTSTISDETIANPNAQIVGDDMVRVHIPRCMLWLDYDEHVDSLSIMDNEVGVTSPKSTTQTLPSFEEYTPPVTYPKEVEKT